MCVTIKGHSCAIHVAFYYTPVSLLPAVRTEVYNSKPFTFVAADPFALTNARMISDMLDKPPKKKDPKKGRGRSASPGPRLPGKAGPGAMYMSLFLIIACSFCLLDHKSRSTAQSL